MNLNYSDPSITKNDSTKIKYPHMFKLTEDDKEWIENHLVSMTTREKCAQMIVPAVLGKDYSNDSLGFARITHFFNR